jgi:hypothetical protein
LIDINIVIFSHHLSIWKLIIIIGVLVGTITTEKIMHVFFIPAWVRDAIGKKNRTRLMRSWGTFMGFWMPLGYKFSKAGKDKRVSGPSTSTKICGEAENPRMTIGVQSTNEERKCATRHNVFTLPPQDQPYVPTAQGPLNDKKGNGSIHQPIDQNGHANAIAFQQYGSHVGIAPWSCDVRKLGKTSVDHDVELDRFNNLKRLDLSVFSEIVSGSKFRLGTRNSTPATT